MPGHELRFMSDVQALKSPNNSSLHSEVRCEPAKAPKCRAGSELFLMRKQAIEAHEPKAKRHHSAVTA